MKITPLLFTDAMVRALLNATKDQTRRPVDRARCPPVIAGFRKVFHGKWQQMLHTTAGFGVTFAGRYGDEGDICYVREACAASERRSDGQDGVIYIADRQFIPIKDTTKAADAWVELNHYGQKRGHSSRRGRIVPNIHMPRWASRMTLVLLDVRIEQLHEITEDDARREGVNGRDEYLRLWDRIHGPGAAAKNPFVYVLEFRRIEQQVDEYLASASAR